jgi:hypothetical protein
MTEIICNTIAYTIRAEAYIIRVMFGSFRAILKLWFAHVSNLTTPKTR